ncbi:anti-phage ZorAB system protein ZorA [Candidatus Cetobacterium colombiensis]|uniref:Anti-phage ZorAB system protein ZorA n=1 Tax=Candidatus Cetobacterium colombiensis TaxID=3073100 RepID=A0ABU4W9P1_9FUSO|nr:anti-phage ZorAB system protein ZorA [Candidatus Cetobacterium colombiensis]MDX8335213.1 anti-phage ZorAB system protein ZorA [Candidatus Cetobacterium colombiensis]
MKRIGKLNNPLLYVVIFAVAWLLVTMEGWNALRNSSKGVILSSMNGEQDKLQLKENYLENINFNEILEKLKNENKIKIENEDVLEVINEENSPNEGIPQDPEMLSLKEGSTSNLTAVEKIIVDILKNKSLPLEELKNQFLENSFSMKKYLEAFIGLQKSGYIRTDISGEVVLDSSVETSFLYLTPNERAIITTFKENSNGGNNLNETELKNQYMVKTQSYKNFQEALKTLKEKNIIEKSEIKKEKSLDQEESSEENPVINFLKNNSEKSYTKEQLKKKLNLKNYLNFNSNIQEVSKQVIKLGDILKYNSLKDSEKKVISILYQNQDGFLTEEQFKNMYLNKNFEVDYQELLKDNILKEEVNSIIYKEKMTSSNEKFFIFMSALFMLTLFVRVGRDYKNISNLKNFREELETEKDYSNLNQWVDENLEDSPIKRQWKNFRDSLAEKYRMIDPDFFFNFDILYRDEISYRLFSYIPQILLGAGMLGTFYGLSLGLSSLDLSTMNSIQDGVGELLSGVKTAFYTSLFGLVFSLLLSFFYGLYFSSIEKMIVKIKNKSIDFISKSPEKNPMDKIIDALDGIKSSNNDMAKNLSSQIGIMSENIKTSISGISESFGADFRENLTTSLDKIFNENFITNLNLSLNQISEVFLENSKKMVEFKDEVQNSIDQLSGLKDSYVDVLKETSSLKLEFNETMESINSNLQTISTEVDGVSEKYKEISSNLGNILESIVTSQDNSIQLLEENKNVMKVATTLLENSKNILDAEKSVQELWNSYEDTFKEINNNLSENLDTYKISLENTTTKLREILKENSNEYNTFIKSQTVDYINEMKKGIVMLFTDYDQNLTTAVSKFNGVLLDFSEKMNEFTDSTQISTETISEKIEVLEEKIESIKTERKEN